MKKNILSILLVLVLASTCFVGIQQAANALDSLSTAYQTEGIDLKDDGKWVTKNGNKYHYDANGRLSVYDCQIAGKWYYFYGSGEMHTGWLKYYRSGKYRYFNTDGTMATGWKQINGYWYYFKPDGYMAIYTNTIGDKTYYFYGSGEMHTGWLRYSNGKYCYFNSDGTMAKGWEKINNRYYYFHSNGYRAAYTNVIDGKTYYFYGSGEMHTGWLKYNNGKYRYFNSDGSMATGFNTINGSTYYFKPDGTMAIYTNTIDGNTYYFYGSGEMHKGWLQNGSNKRWMYYNTDGVMAKGWKKINGKSYYFNSNGYRLTGLNTIDGKTYYFNDNGVMVTGWVVDSASNTTRYFNEEGSMLKGWQTINGKVYFFDNNGNMYSGSHTIDGMTYFFESNGVLSGGFVTDKKTGKLYFLNDDGSTITKGWITHNGNHYFLLDNGTLAQYTTVINGNTYYFDSNNAMHTGWLTKSDGNVYYFGSNGIMYTGWNTISGNKYYFDSEGKMYIYTHTINGKTYYFNSKGHMQTGWVTNSSTGKKRYFDSNGVMLTGWQTINNKKYYFESDGYMRTETLKDEANNIQYIFNSDGSLNRTAQLHLPEVNEDFETPSIPFNEITNKNTDVLKYAEKVRDGVVNGEEVKFSGYTKLSEKQIATLVQNIAEMACSEELDNSTYSGDYLAHDGISVIVTGYSYGKYDNTDYANCEMSFLKNHPYSLSQEKSFKKQISTIINNADIKNKSRYEKVKFIYEYVCQNVEYEDLGSLSYTAYGALINKKAVCQGYAMLFYCMCKEAGVPVRYVTSINHAWDIVQMEDGLWYNIDCTYGAPFRAASIKYFLAGSNELDFWKNAVYEEPYNTTDFQNKHPLSQTAYKAK